MNFDKTLVDFRKIGAEFVLKNFHPEEKEKAHFKHDKMAIE